MAASSMPISAPVATSGRSMTRHSTRNIRKTAFGHAIGRAAARTQGRGAGSGPDQRKGAWNGSRAVGRAGEANHSGAGLPQHAALARPRKLVGMSRPAQYLFNGHALLARLDGGG